MDVAIVTGAAAGLGLAVAKKLVAIGFRVYGLGGDYRETSYSHRYFVPAPCRLEDLAEVTSKVEDILRREGDVFALVNNAKVYPAENINDSDWREIQRAAAVNLALPVVLTQLALPGLRRLQGHIINLAATSAMTARGGPAGAACDGGLRWMSEALFEQLRDEGVHVTLVFPRSNRVRPENQRPAAIEAGAVAETVAQIVAHRGGNVITEVVIRPQRTREPRTLPPLDLPRIDPQAEIRPGQAALAKTRRQVKHAAKKVQTKPKASRKKTVETKKRLAEEKQAAARSGSAPPARKKAAVVKKTYSKVKRATKPAAENNAAAASRSARRRKPAKKKTAKG